MPSTSHEGNWKLMNRFILRTTGFPFHLVENLKSEEVEMILQDWNYIFNERERIATFFLQGVFEKMMDWEWSQATEEEKQFAQVKKLKKFFIKREPIPNSLIKWWKSRKHPQEWIEIPNKWNGIFDREKELMDLGEKVFKKEFKRMRVFLKEMASNAKFQEAVFLSSPSAYKALERHLKAWDNARRNEPLLNKDIRKNESLIYSYLQRFCTKNDTTSFFGPINYGQFSANTANSLLIKHTLNHKLQNKTTFLSQWCIREMAKKISEDTDVLKCIPPRRNPLVTYENDSVYYHFISKEKKLPNIYIKLLECINGENTPSDLAELLNLNIEKIYSMLTQLKKAEIIRHQLELCATSVEMLEDLLAKVKQLPPYLGKKWIPFVEKAIHLRNKFQKAPWPEREEILEEAESWFGSWYTDEVRRKSGKLYGDRLIFTEDCVGSVESFTVGGDLYKKLYSSTALLLEFLKIPAALRWLDYQEHALGVFNKIKGVRSSIPYTELIQVLDNPQIPFVTSRVKEFEKRASQLLVESDEGLVLNKESLRQLEKEYKEIVEPVLKYTKFSLPSPDLMISASSKKEIEDGQFNIVLGEIHDDWSTIYDGVFGYFYKDTKTVRKEMHDFINSLPKKSTMASVVSNRRHKHITPELPGWTIELGSNSIKKQESVIPLGEVTVTNKSGVLVLQFKGQDILLYPGDVGTIAHGAFSLLRIIPIKLSTNCSYKGNSVNHRIYIEDLIYQRRSFIINTSEFKDREVPNGLELLKAGQWIKSKYDLPNQFFIKWNPTEKPVYVDLRNYWALDWLWRTGKKVKEMEFVEFLPNEKNLWWEGSEGVQPCELRMGFTYSYDSFPTIKDQMLVGELV